MNYESEADVRAMLEELATQKGYRLNPDSEAADRVIKGLLMRYQSKGELYCPCRLLTNDEEQNRKIICPCEYHEEEIEEKGICHCNLLAAK
ncbi:MAG: ferredoxin-thioredoxin reductase catalytic domain-containing protein [Planctomycetota bacterium]|jgi:ferredoxin-thioredoxin reductase catalytic subunit